MRPDQDASPADTVADSAEGRNQPPVVGTRGERRRCLGPLVRMVPLEGPLAGRVYAALVAAAAGALLAVAIALPPSPVGMGTHRRLGLPACGMVTLTGLPCPTCGMTTSFAWTVRGHLGDALRAQAAGFVAAIGTIATFLFALIAVIGGYRPEFNWYRIDPMRLVWIGTALIIGAWGLKMALGLLDGSLPAR